MATDRGYERGNYLRVCDICGHRWHFGDLTPIGELKFACPDCAPGLTALQISRHNAKAKPITVKPNRWAKGTAVTPLYQNEEAALFNFIATYAPGEIFTVTNGMGAIGGSSPAAAAWAAIYMADLVLQSLRPTRWGATAKTVIKTCCDYLLTQQANSPASLSHGGILATATTWSTTSTVAAGIAWLKAYAALGDINYLLAAERAAVFCRRMQCADLNVNVFTVYPAGSTARYHVGGLAATLTNNSGTMNIGSSYLVQDIAAIWFLTLLKAVRGGSKTYGDSASTADFISATAASLDIMIAELSGFSLSGAQDANAAGALTSGLSAASLKVSYDAATNSGGTATWLTNGGGVNSESVTLALRGMFEAQGMTVQVTSIADYLRSVTPNAANAIAPGTPPAVVLASLKGDSDSTLCPVSALLVTASPPTAASGVVTYAWASLGLLAPIWSARYAADFRRAKDTLTVPRRSSLTDLQAFYLGILGNSGFDFQPVTASAGGRFASVAKAAKVGHVYRYAPGHNVQLRG